MHVTILIQGLAYTDTRVNDRERKTGVRRPDAEGDGVRRLRRIDMRPVDGLANMDLYRLREKTE